MIVWIIANEKIPPFWRDFLEELDCLSIDR